MPFIMSASASFPCHGPLSLPSLPFYFWGGWELLVVEWPSVGAEFISTSCTLHIRFYSYHIKSKPNLTSPLAQHQLQSSGFHILGCGFY